MTTQTAQQVSGKSRVVFWLLQMFLGSLGVGRFYSGHTKIAVAQIALNVIGGVAGVLITGVPITLGYLWAFVDGWKVLIIGGTDAQGRRLR